MICGGIRPLLEDFKPETRVLGLDSEMWAVATRCWHPDASKRCSAAQLCEKLASMTSQWENPRVARPATVPTPVQAAKHSLVGSSTVPSESGKLRKRPSPSIQPGSYARSGSNSALPGQTASQGRQLPSKLQQAAASRALHFSSERTTESKKSDPRLRSNFAEHPSRLPRRIRRNRSLTA